jgi:hypothetical protein
MIMHAMHENIVFLYPIKLLLQSDYNIHIQMN